MPTFEEGDRIARAEAEMDAGKGWMHESRFVMQTLRTGFSIMSKKALTTIGILLRRYPAAVLLIVLNTIFTIWAIGAEKDASRLPLSLLYSSGLAIVFSAAGRLVADRFALKERVALGVQVFVLLSFAALAWMFHDYGRFEEHFHYSYYLTLAAFSALTAIAMSFRENPEMVFPKLTLAGMMGCVAAIATGGGVTLVVLAVEKLFGVKTSCDIYEMAWGHPLPPWHPDSFSLMRRVRRNSRIRRCGR